MKRKDSFITKKYFDKAIKDYSETIIEAVNFGFEGNKSAHKKLEEKIDKTWKSIDGYVKAQEAFRQEFIIMKEEIKQIKRVLKEKLGVEVRAI